MTTIIGCSILRRRSVSARAAARRAGAKRSVFLSSIRAQCGPTVDTVQREGGRTQTDRCLRRIQAQPCGRARSGGVLDLDWVSLRAVLVYGLWRQRQHGATGCGSSRSPFPLPLGSLRARRLLLALENLLAVILETVLEAPGTLRRVLIAADLQALNDRGNDRGHAALPGRQPNVFPLPRSAASSPAPHRRPRRNLPAVVRLVGRRSLGLDEFRLGRRRWATLAGLGVAVDAGKRGLKTGCAG